MRSPLPVHSARAQIAPTSDCDNAHRCSGLMTARPPRDKPRQTKHLPKRASPAQVLEALRESLWSLFSSLLSPTRYVIPSASLRAALASDRVESSVGSETSSGRTISGISVQPSTMASQPLFFSFSMTSLKYKNVLGHFNSPFGR